MWKKLPSLIGLLAARADAAVLTLSGRPGDFGVGADLQDVREATASREQAREFCAEVVLAASALAKCTLPTVAILTGVAIGGSAELALAADFRLAERGARVNFPFTRLGVVPDSLTIRRLVRLLGEQETRRVLLLKSHGWLTAGEVRSPLFDWVVDKSSLDTELERVVADLTAGSRFARHAIRQQLDVVEPVEEAQAIEVMAESFVTGDVAQLVASVTI